jgi:hypothetical protein
MRFKNSTKANELYIFFCHYFLSCIVGKKFGYKLSKNFKLSDIVTPSDEALTLLLIENNEARWLKLNQEDICEDELPPSRFTSTGQKKKGRGFTVKGYGWNPLAIERFNELVAGVKEDRKEHGDAFDIKFEEYWRNKTLLARRHKKQKIDLPPKVAAVNDLFDENGNVLLDGYDSHWDDEEFSDDDEGDEHVDEEEKEILYQNYSHEEDDNDSTET